MLSILLAAQFFEGDLDYTHPLGFGYVNSRIASHRNTTIKLKAPADPYATVVAYTDDPLLSGYASERRQKDLAGSPMLVAERMGRGSVILFSDNPLFRGTFLGTNKLFMNTLFFSTAFTKAANFEESEEHGHGHAEAED